MTGSRSHLEIDRVRSATDLAALIGEHVKLQAKGREHVGVCPFHDDRSPSMHVVTHKGDGFYKCFACGASGDCFTFVQEYHRVGFGEALRMLADRAGIVLAPRGGDRRQTDEPDRGDLLDACRFAESFFSQTLAHPAHGAAGREVVERRGISPAMVEAFGIGFAPPGFDNLKGRVESGGIAGKAAVAAGLLRKKDGRAYDAFRNRLIFPIRDDLGRPIAFGARAIAPDDDPKYLNSPETRIFSKSSTLYGLDQARRSIVDAGTAIVTEGYTDVVACHQAGVTNVVGTLGTALTDGHAKRLARLCRDVALVFDGDAAGQRAADRAVAVFFAAEVDVRVCVLPGGADPDDFLKSDGPEAFVAAVAASEDALAWKLRRFRDAIDPAAGVSARQAALESFLDDLVELGFGAMPTVRRSLVLDQLQRLLRVPAAELAGQIADRQREAERRRRSRAARERANADSTSPASAPAPAPAAPAAAAPAAPARKPTASQPGRRVTAPAPRAAATAPSPPASRPASAGTAGTVTDADGRPLVDPGDVDLDPDVAMVEIDPLLEVPGRRPGGTPTAAPSAPAAGQDPADPDARPRLARIDDRGPHARARIMAERTLAGLALRDAAAFRTVAGEIDLEPASVPGLARLAGPEDAAGVRPFADRLIEASGDPGRIIRDPAAATVLAALGTWLADPDAGRAPTVPELMRSAPEIESEADVARLYFEAEALDAAAEEPGLPLVREATRALLEAIEREAVSAEHARSRLDAASGQLDAGQLAEIIAARRDAGPSPAAIAVRPGGGPPSRPIRRGRGGPDRRDRFSGPRDLAPP